MCSSSLCLGQLLYTGCVLGFNPWAACPAVMQGCRTAGRHAPTWTRIQAHQGSAWLPARHCRGPPPGVLRYSEAQEAGHAPEAHSLQGHGRPTQHKPEIILNRFNTRLGTRIGRLLASLYPQTPQFRGRQVATFHNQRDFIFFRWDPRARRPPQQSSVLGWAEWTCSGRPEIQPALAH